MLSQVNRPLSLFASYCAEDQPGCFEETFEPFLRALFVVLLIQQILIETVQVYMELPNKYLEDRENWNPLALFTTKHFSQSSNWIDLFSLFCNVLVLWMIQMDVDVIKIRVIASISTVLIWVQLIFWFRLSDSLAHHVDLIIATIEDIGGFIFVLLTFLMMFASGFYML